MTDRKRVAILISGRGSNMAALAAPTMDTDYPAEIALVVSNRPDAAGLAHAEKIGIADGSRRSRAFPDRAAFEAAIDARLEEARVDIICLAGFMRLLTEVFVERWRDRLINIHPSLLPSFQGLNTHERALAAGVKLHGCTVHFVRPAMDAGPIIAQAAVPVLATDTPERSRRARPWRRTPHLPGGAGAGGGRAHARGRRARGDCRPAARGGPRRAHLAGVDLGRDELPPRLSRRRLRRCRQACGARPSHRAAEAEGHRLPRHRHPCRHRALRSHQQRGGALGRMAGRHRPAVAARPRTRPRRPPRPLAGGGEGRQSGERHAALLSRLAVDRPPSLAPPGPADRGRAAIRTTPRRLPRCLPATFRCAPSRSTAGWRSAPSCRPRSGAGWCWSIRPTRSRTSSTGFFDGFANAHRRWPTGSLCPLVSGQGPCRRRPAARRACAKSGIRRLLRAELTVRERGAGGTFNGTGPRHLQSALAIRARRWGRFWPASCRS